MPVRPHAQVGFTIEVVLLGCVVDQEVIDHRVHHNFLTLHGFMKMFERLHGLKVAKNATTFAENYRNWTIQANAQ
jgi:hypothetical protein